MLRDKLKELETKKERSEIEYAAKAFKLLRSNDAVWAKPHWVDDIILQSYFNPFI